MEIGTKDVYPIAISDTERSLASWVSSDLAPRSRTTPTRADEARRQLVDNHPEWPEDARQAILNGEVLPGMTRPQAMAACGIGFMREMSYRPYRERWFYDRDPLIVVLYFLDDTLVGAKGIDEHDTNVVLPTVDLSVAQTDGQTNVAPGQQIEYQIVVANNGPNPVVNAEVSDTLPSSLTNITFTSATTTGTVSGNTLSGNGNINDLVTMGPNSSVTYTVRATVALDAVGVIENFAKVTPPATVNTQVCRAPAAIALTTLFSPVTSTGKVMSMAVPSPSWPSWFSPQHLTSPAIVTAQVCCQPAAIALTPAGSASIRRTGRCQAIDSAIAAVVVPGAPEALAKVMIAISCPSHRR